MTTERTCLTECEVMPAAALFATTPAFICEKHGYWATMTEREFFAKFGRAFAAKPRMFSGSAKDRRRQKRGLSRQKEE